MKDPLAGFWRELIASPEVAWRDAQAMAKFLIDQIVRLRDFTAEEAESLRAELSAVQETGRAELEARIDQFVQQTLGRVIHPWRRELVQLRRRTNALIERADYLESSIRKRNEFPGE